MRFLVAYASKTGTTEKAARQLAEFLSCGEDTAELCDLSASTPDVSAYDAIAVGGPVRMGRFHKLARRFIASHAHELQSKPVGIFCCRCGKDDTRALLAPQLDAEIMRRAVSVSSFGGEMDPAKQKGLDKLVVAMVTKSDQSADMRPEGVVTQRVKAFADALRAAANA